MGPSPGSAQQTRHAPLAVPPLSQELLFQGQGGMDDAGQPLYRASIPHLCQLSRLRELTMKCVTLRARQPATVGGCCAPHAGGVW